MVSKGSLVKMRLGHSGPGIVLEIMERHPRAAETHFSTIRSSLQEPHVKVFWHDLQANELVNLSKIEVVE